MSLPCIAIMAPGDMGHAVGRVLREHGHDVVTCLAGRSARTCGLAEMAGLRDVSDLDALVGEAAMVLSIVPPALAVQQAEDMAAAMKRTGASPVFVDCNAVSPQTMAEVARAVEGAGAPLIDCAIIGTGPTPTNVPRFYVTGADTAPMTALNGKGIEVIALSGPAGRASALKMAYAGLTKGTNALYTAVLMAAERMGLFDELVAEFEHSQPAALKNMKARISRLPADSGRWIREMEEIAETFRAAGVPGNFHDGAAQVFRILEQTPFAQETRQTIDASRTMEQSVKEFARHLPGAREAADD